MDAQKTGNLINFLRSKKSLTQKQLAQMVNVSDKAVSKWERGDGCPDVGILPILAQALETDVDSLLKGELPKREMTKEEIDVMLKEMEANNPNAVKYDKQFIKPDVKVCYYDFLRPDVFGRNEMQDLWTTASILCEKLKTEFSGNRRDFYSIKITSVDQLNNGEFLQGIPSLTFFYSYDYNNSGFSVEIDPLIGKQLLRQDLKKYPELMEYDVDFLQIAYVNEFVRLWQDLLYERTDKSISREAFEKPLTKKTLLPRSTNEEIGQMCLLISFEIETDSGYGNINFQLSYDYCEKTLSKLNFFNHNEPLCRYLTDIKSQPCEENIFVEFGRYLSGSFDFEPGTIFITNIKFKEPINVLVNNEVRYKGDVLAVDANFGVVIKEVLPQEKIVRYDEEHYLAIRLGGTYIPKEDINKIGENTVLQLGTAGCEPVSIIQDGKCVARGQIVIADNTYAVRIIE